MMLTKEAIERSIPEHRSVRELAATLGVGVNLLYRKIKEYELSLDELLDRSVDDSPSEEEIAARAAEIRKSWSAAEHRRRAGAYSPRRWRVPSIRVGELVGVKAMRSGQ